MAREWVSGRLVLDDAVVPGRLAVEDGVIAAIEPDAGEPALSPARASSTSCPRLGWPRCDGWS